MNKKEMIIQKKNEFMHQKDPNIQRQLSTEIKSLYSKISDKNNKIKEIIYPVLRNDISLAFQAPDYSEVISAFKKIQNTNRYKNEDKGNIIIMKNMLIKAYFFEYLDSRDEEFLDKANKFLTEINSLDITDVLNENQLRNEKLILATNNEIYKAILEDNLWTETSFSLPFSLSISEEEKMFTINDIEVYISTEKIQETNLPISTDNGVLQIKYDKYGIQTKTNIKLRINEYLSPQNKVTVYHYDEKLQRSEVLTSSLEILNKIITRYRIVSNEYWVDNVDLNMIIFNSLKIYADTTVIKDIILQSELEFQISPSYEYLNEDHLRNLSILLNVDDDDLLYEELLADAKNYLLINKLREAVISLNSSFENFFYSRMKRILEKYVEFEVLENYFKGIITYELFNKKDRVDEEMFDMLVKEGIIPQTVPSVYNIVNKYFQFVPEEERIVYSKNKFKNTIKEIRKDRNDIIHGNRVIKLTTKQVNNSIMLYEELIDALENKHFSN